MIRKENPKNKDGLERKNVGLSLETHNMLCLYSVRADKSIRDIADAAVREYINRYDKAKVPQAHKDDIIEEIEKDRQAFDAKLAKITNSFVP